MRRPTAFDVILCIVLFTVVMSALSWVLHQTVPGFIAWSNGMLGANVVTGIMLAVWVAAGLFVLVTLLRPRLARRRGASVRKDQ